ncbi:CHAT domain-containing protein [Leptolyngbya sp. FACHB-16]|uniref:CHAT domain-containing protein n=1 Tax=unclassified Leptolyngbya TaxID=2650499 RepID=UPI001684FB2A|nr:CHAT domain-containing protein [Leptolyngbya sp. FACHB-16]MBD2153078.1 CHAT domain-containing protein [Leptolyngbya sp. FACHB-16]
MPIPRTVLMLSANPRGTAPLRLDEELREVKEGLTKRSKLRDNFTLVSEHAVRTRDVHRALLDSKPYILHFSGHGTGAKGLLLEDEVGDGKAVSGEAIAQLLALFKDSLQCVVLNACYSEVQAKAIHEHIPFIIGMNHVCLSNLETKR